MMFSARLTRQWVRLTPSPTAFRVRCGPTSGTGETFRAAYAATLPDHASSLRPEASENLACPSEASQSIQYGECQHDSRLHSGASPSPGNSVPGAPPSGRSHPGPPYAPPAGGWSAETFPARAACVIAPGPAGYSAVAMSSHAPANGLHYRTTPGPAGSGTAESVK